jgi:hypothetical protein
MVAGSTGCQNARAGVGLPTTIIYSNYTKPMLLNRPEGPPRGAGRPPMIPGEAGIGQPEGRNLDPGTLTPRSAPQIPGGIKIPPNLVETRIRTHRINLIPRGVTALFGIPGIPTIDPATIGWGDMSANAMFEAGEYDEWVYADANEIDILGIYTRCTIIGYGVVKDESRALPAADWPPSETP